MGDKTMIEKKTLRLRLVGEIPGYYRSYYEDETTGKFYALTNFRSVREWNTTACNGGEPDMPLKDGLLIEIVAEGQVISRERISRVDDSVSVGLPVVDEPPAPSPPHCGNEKKAAAPASGQTEEESEKKP